MARYIDADLLIFKLETQDYSGAPDTLEDWTPEDMTRAEIADIEHAPTADVVERKRGKWKEWNDHFSALVFCSECGYDGGLPNYHFCPNCGAEMEGNDGEIH